MATTVPVRAGPDSNSAQSNLLLPCPSFSLMHKPAVDRCPPETSLHARSSVETHLRLAFATDRSDLVLAGEPGRACHQSRRRRTRTPEPGTDPSLERQLAPIRRDTAAPQPVTIASDHGERIELSFHCDEPGIVVLTDQAYPGWTASRTLDGTKQPPAHVETAWGQCRMVRIPRAGGWIVRFEFAPTSPRLGRAVSLVAIAGWLALSEFYWWTRQDKGEPIHSCDTPELQSDEAPAGGQHPPEPHRTR